ncbi:phosphotransferase family protein [Luedemannella flava]
MERLGSGRTADVFAVDGERVVRRYRESWDTAREAAIMTYVGGHGYPVPAVHGSDGPELVMERLDGVTMLSALVSGGSTRAPACGCSPTCTPGCTPCRPGRTGPPASRSSTSTCTRRLACDRPPTWSSPRRNSDAGMLG